MEVRSCSEQVFGGRLLNVYSDTVLLDDGSSSVREIVKHPGGVCIAALDDCGNVWFVRQYRYVLGADVEELPAGKLEPGEDPDIAAARELLEETGFTADTLIRAGISYPSPGYTSEVVHLYIARGLHPGPQQPDDEERITLFSLPLSEAAEGVISGRFKDMKTQTLIMILDHMENKSK